MYKYQLCYVEQTKMSRFCDEQMCSVGIFGSLLHDTISSMPICVTIHRVFWTTKMILIMDFSILVFLHASELTFKGNIKPQLQWRYLAHFLTTKLNRMNFVEYSRNHAKSVGTSIICSENVYGGFSWVSFSHKRSQNVLICGFWNWNDAICTHCSITIPSEFEIWSLAVGGPNWCSNRSVRFHSSWMEKNLLLVCLMVFSWCSSTEWKTQLIFPQQKENSVPMNENKPTYVIQSVLKFINDTIG